MKSFCISTPGDVHEWLTAEARRRGCSVSHLLCTLAVLAALLARLDAVAANLTHAAPAFSRERRGARARAEVGILPTTTNQYDQQ